MTGNRAVSAGAAVAAGLLIASCSTSGPDPSEPSTSSTVASSPTTTGAEVTTDPAELAAEQAVALVPTYVQTIDELYEDPSRPLDDVYAVAVASEATAEATAIQAFRAQGYQQAGRSQVVTATAGPVDLTNDPNAAPEPLLPTVTVTACIDVSQVQATDAGGTSVVAPDRPPYLIQQLMIVNIDYPDAGSWRVTEAPNQQAQSCDG